MAFTPSDTVVGIATPPGRGGIGVVRLSGGEARTIARALLARDAPLEPRYATHSYVKGRPSDAAPIDEVVATFFPSPHSYTGEDVVEISAHGSPVVLRAIVDAAMASGARLAEPGEFTLRAFLNGRIDLPQAEAVADLVDAVTPLQARAAFDQLQGTLTRTIGEIDRALFDLVARLEASVDFPEEGYHFALPSALASEIDELASRADALVAEARRGRLLRDGLQIAIVGTPNVGKSSVFNALAGSARAIVTAVPGTTRDLVTETIDLDGLRVTLVDTAGVREAEDPAEVEGVARAQAASRVADLVLAVVDRSRPLEPGDRHVVSQTTDVKRLIVINKIDLEAAWAAEALTGSPAVEISATLGVGVEALRQAIQRALDVEPSSEPPAITNVRHAALVARARDALTRAADAVRAEGGSLSEEFVLADLQEARAALEEISGRRAPDDLLAHIFARFCIGK